MHLCEWMHRWKVNIGSGSGLVLKGNKPIPEPMLTQIYVAIWHHNVLTQCCLDKPRMVTSKAFLDWKHWNSHPVPIDYYSMWVPVMFRSGTAWNFSLPLNYPFFKPIVVFIICTGLKKLKFRNSLGVDESLHLTFYNGCSYLSISE